MNQCLVYLMVVLMSFTFLDFFPTYSDLKLRNSLAHWKGHIESGFSRNKLFQEKIQKGSKGWFINVLCKKYQWKFLSPWKRRKKKVGSYQ